MWKKAIIDDINRVGKDSDVRGFEKIYGIYLSAEPFSIENDLLTPTFKLKRPQAKTKYIENINALYENMEDA